MLAPIWASSDRLSLRPGLKGSPGDNLSHLGGREQASAISWTFAGIFASLRHPDVSHW